MELQIQFAKVFLHFYLHRWDAARVALGRMLRHGFQTGRREGVKT